MKVVYYAVEGKGRETDLAHEMGIGVKRLGDEFEIRDASEFVEPDTSVDVAVVFALKGAARRILETYRTMGSRTILMDKGLIRASTGLGAPSGYSRVSLDEFMPLGRIRRMMDEGVSPSRWADTRLVPLDRPPRMDGSIIYAGSSQKYCDFHDLGNEHDYAVDLIHKIRKKIGKHRRLIYRPKPSFDLATEIEGTVFSRPPETLAPLLRRARALVTHGSHASIDAILAGIPTIVLGSAAAQPVASHDLEGLASVDPLYYPDRETRAKWLSAIAWWQWKAHEMSDGSMWRFLREEMEKPNDKPEPEQADPNPADL